MTATVSTHIPSNFVPSEFDVTDEGVFIGDEDSIKQLTTVPAWVSGLTRTLSASHWSIVITWLDLDGKEKTAIVAYDMLQSRNGVLDTLMRDGLFIIPGCQQMFARFLALSAALPDIPRIRTHRQLGFFTVPNGEDEELLAFMLPNQCILPQLVTEVTEVTEAEEVVEETVNKLVSENAVTFHPLLDSPTFSAYSASGTLAEWQNSVQPLADNPLLVFALSVAFAGPFLNVSNMDNVIFHLFGNSSTGKTTALQVASSVWGKGADPQSCGHSGTLIERWNTTQNAMEPIAATHSGIFLAMDELGSSGDSVISVYNITAGKGKARMSETGALRDQHVWTLCTLSSGEFSMLEKIESGTNRKAKTGEIIRAMDIPVTELVSASAEATDQETERQKIEQLKRACSEVYGTAGPAFIQAVLNTYSSESSLKAHLLSVIDEYHQQMVEFASTSGWRLSSAHVRALRRFALVMTVGILAIEHKILPFTEDVLCYAMETVISAWLSALPPLCEGERALAAIRHYVLKNTAQILDYDSWENSGFLLSVIPHSMKAIQKRDLLLFTQEQLQEACNGMPLRETLHYLRDQGMLKREKDKMTYRVDIQALNVKRVAFYALKVQDLMSGCDMPEPEFEEYIPEFDDE